MKKIEVKILNPESIDQAEKLMVCAARLTQRGHQISCLDDFMDLYEKPYQRSTVANLVKLPHPTIQKFGIINVVVVGASRRFLAQITRHQNEVKYMSASLQYSDYSGNDDFVVPYSLIEAEHEGKLLGTLRPTEFYLGSCREAMIDYKYISELTDNDTAGYVAPHGLRNILIMQGNHQSWDYWIRLRGCNRNTVETQYVTMRIWEELLKTEYGEEFFGNSGADCMLGTCHEGKMCCGVSMKPFVKQANELGVTVPRLIIDTKWPLLKEA